MLCRRVVRHAGDSPLNPATNAAAARVSESVQPVADSSFTLQPNLYRARDVSLACQSIRATRVLNEHEGRYITVAVLDAHSKRLGLSIRWLHTAVAAGFG